MDIKKIKNYLKEVLTEAKKITWPTKKHTINYTLIVIFISIAIGIFLGIADWLIVTFFNKFIFKI